MVKEVGRAMHRRSFLWAALIAILDACIDRTPTQSGTKGEEGAPRGDTKPSLAPPSSPPHSDAPTASPVPSPMPTPEQPIVIAGAPGAVSVSDVVAVPQTLSNAGYEFTVAGVDEGSGEPLAVNVLASDADGTLRVFVSNALDRKNHAYWTPVQVDGRRVASTSNAAAAIPRRNGRYLVVGRELTEISDAITLDGPTLKSDQLTALEEYADEGGVSTSTYRLQSGHYSIIVPSDAVLQGTKPVLVFVHGAGGDPSIWDAFLSFLKKDPRFREEFLKRFIVVLWRYGSQRAIDTNARAMVAALRQAYGPRLVYFVGHSMGGLLSRCGYAELFGEGLAGGIVTLGTPHRGSPLAIPKLIRCALSSHPYPTALIALYQLFVNNFLGGMLSLKLTKRLSDYVTELDRLYSDGFLSLASHESEFGIPTREFTLWLSSGILKGIPITEKLTAEENLLVPVVGSALTKISGVIAAIRSRVSFNKQRISMVEAIEAYERTVGCLATPHVVAYGGTIPPESSDESIDLLARFASVGGIATLAADTSRELQQAFLRWVSRSIMPTIPSASGRASAGNDGLVRVEDALGLRDGDPIGRNGSIDQTAVAKRRPAWMKDARIEEGYTHLDLVTGKGNGDGEYFASVASDILAFDRAHDANRSTSLTASERSAAVAFLRQRFEGGFLSEEITASLDTASVQIAAVTGKVNRFTASFRVLITDYTYTNEFGDPARGYQSYIASLARLSGKWYFYRSPGHTLDGYLRL